MTSSGKINDLGKQYIGAASPDTNGGGSAGGPTVSAASATIAPIVGSVLMALIAAFVIC
jgi:hypothetical protein